MSLEVWVGEDFDYGHEADDYYRVLAELERKFASSDEAHLLLVNFTCQGIQIDLSLLKPDAIVAIELKHYGGKITGTENGAWYAEDERGVRVDIKSTGNNPLSQVSMQHRKLYAWSRQNKTNLFGANIQRAWETNIGTFGIVLFTGSADLTPLKVRTRREFVCTLDTFLRTLDRCKVPTMRLRGEELRNFAKGLGLRQVPLEDAKRGLLSPAADAFTAWKSYLEWFLRKHSLSERGGPRIDRTEFVRELRRRNRAVVLGPPGVGKSDVLRELGCAFAKAAVNNPGTDFAVPLLLPLRGYFGMETVEEALASRIAQVDPSLERLLPTTLATPRAVVVLDGLDELPDPRRALTQIRRFLAKHPGVKLYISSRASSFKVTVGTEDLFDSFDVVRLEPSTEREARKYLEAATAGAIEPLWDALKGHLARWSYTPLNLSIVARLANAGKLRAKSLGKLYYDYVSHVLERELARLPGRVVSSPPALLDSLADLGWDMLLSLNAEVPAHKAIRTIMDMGKCGREYAEEVIHIASRAELLLEEGGSVRFAHLNFRDFFGALYYSERERQPDTPRLTVPLAAAIARFAASLLEDPSGFVETLADLSPAAAAEAAVHAENLPASTMGFVASRLSESLASARSYAEHLRALELVVEHGIRVSEDALRTFPSLWAWDLAIQAREKLGYPTYYEWDLDEAMAALGVSATETAANSGEPVQCSWDRKTLRSIVYRAAQYEKADFPEAKKLKKCVDSHSCDCFTPDDLAWLWREVVESSFEGKIGALAVAYPGLLNRIHQFHDQVLPSLPGLLLKAVRKGDKPLAYFLIASAVEAWCFGGRRDVPISNEAKWNEHFAGALVLCLVRCKASAIAFRAGLVLAGLSLDSDSLAKVIKMLEPLDSVPAPLAGVDKEWTWESFWDRLDPPSVDPCALYLDITTRHDLSGSELFLILKMIIEAQASGRKQATGFEDVIRDRSLSVPVRRAALWCVKLFRPTIRLLSVLENVMDDQAEPEELRREARESYFYMAFPPG